MLLAIDLVALLYSHIEYFVTKILLELVYLYETSCSLFINATKIKARGYDDYAYAKIEYVSVRTYLSKNRIRV